MALNILNVVKQVGELQGKMKAAQAELEQLTFGGESGAGLVKVTLTGAGAMQKLSIDPSLMKAGENDVLEDLIVAAFNDARRKVAEATSEKMGAVTAGLPIPPGLKLF